MGNIFLSQRPETDHNFAHCAPSTVLTSKWEVSRQIVALLDLRPEPDLTTRTQSPEVVQDQGRATVTQAIRATIEVSLGASSQGCDESKQISRATRVRAMDVTTASTSMQEAVTLVRGAVSRAFSDDCYTAILLQCPPSVSSRKVFSQVAENALWSWFRLETVLSKCGTAGELELGIHALFERAKRAKPAVVSCDHWDLAFPARFSQSVADARALAAIEAEMDALSLACSFDSGVVLLASVDSENTSGTPRTHLSPDRFSVFLNLGTLLKANVRKLGVSSSLRKDSQLLTVQQDNARPKLRGITKQVELLQACLQDAFWDVCARASVDTMHGALLYGPPGSGKTSLAKCARWMLQRDTDTGPGSETADGPVPSLWLNSADLISSEIGTAERKMKHVFATARSVSPCIVIIENVEYIAPSRASGFSNGVTRINSSHSSAGLAFRRLLGTLLQELDLLSANGFESTDVGQRDTVFVLATTGNRDGVDSALLRPGRLEVHIEMTYPDLQGRRDILRDFLEQHAAYSNESDLRNTLAKDIDVLLDRLDGLSAPSLQQLCSEASLLAMRSTLENGISEAERSHTVSRERLESALKTLLSSKDAEYCRGASR